MKTRFANLAEEKDIFFDDLFNTTAIISQRHHDCMKGAYWDGKSVRMRYFMCGPGISVDIMNFMKEYGISWSNVGDKEFGKTIFIFRIIPYDIFDAIEAAINQKEKEMLFFDVESGKAYACKAEFRMSNYCVCFKIQFQNGETAFFHKQDYWEKFVLLNPETDRVNPV